MLDLKKLSEQRNPGRIELPISDHEVAERYNRLFSGAINDVLREFACMNQALPFDIIPFQEGEKTAGIAFTIRSAKDPGVHAEREMAFRAKMLSDIPPDSVCVWDTNRDNVAAHWGGIMTATAKGRGARGAVIDGGIRDSHEIREQSFPVFYRYRTSNGMLGRVRVIDYQVPIEIGGVFIYPGDIVFGDTDGVIVVPRNIAMEVLERTETIVNKEKDIHSWIASGESATDVVKKGGYF
jgi:regulator of RNase E activity RraA